MNTTFSAYVEERCRKFADRVLTFDAEGQPVSYTNFFLTILGFAERFRALDVGPGELVTVSISDPLGAMIARLALLRLGATVLAGRAPTMRARFGLEVRHNIRSELEAPVPEVQDIVVDQTWIAPPGRIVPISEAGLLVRSTSGTTGLPKLRAVGHRAMIVRTEHGAKFRPPGEGPLLNGFRVESSPGSNTFCRVIANGGTTVFAGATPAETLERIRKFGVTQLRLPSYDFARLVEAAEQDPGHDWPLKVVMVGGAALSPGLAARGEAVFGAEVFNTYGSSETGSLAHFRPASEPESPGIVGRPYPVFGIRFRGEAGDLVRPEDGGEIEVRVPPGLQALDYPSLQPLGDAEGWVATGDIGRFLEGGLLQITGRRSEFINLGGTKRAPAFFERIAEEHPTVAQAAAFRAPSPEGFDHVGLVVVPRAGFEPMEFGRFMMARLGADLPIHLATAEALPLNAGGKIDRRALTETFLAQQAATGRAEDHEETLS